MKKQLFILLMAVLMICSCFTACGDEKGLTAMIMKTPPTKTEYLVGEKFDPAGATVEFTYEDGTTEVKELTAGMLPTDLTFNKAGFQSIPVMYTTEDGVAKIAYITVKVIDPNVSAASNLQTARNDAIGKLTAFYKSLVFEAPENYPAIPADDATGNTIASDAKAVFDKAVADINKAGTTEEVQKVFGEAQATLLSLDNYVDWYAAKKVSEIEVAFERDYTDKKDFIENYAACLAVTKRQIARILRADTLADIDALVEEWPGIIVPGAENLLTDLIDKIASLTWPIDLPTDPADDTKPGTNMGIYNEIMDDVNAIMATNDTLLMLQLQAYLENCPAYDLDLDPENEFHKMIIATYNDKRDTYNLNDVMNVFAARVEQLTDAREAADKEDGIEDIIAEAIKDYQYGAIASGSKRHEACKEAWKAFEKWVADYEVTETIGGNAELNYDLVEGYDTLRWLLNVLDNIIPPLYPDYPKDEFSVSISNQIILDQTNVELEAGQLVIDEFEAVTGAPGWSNIWVDKNGDGLESEDEYVFLIKNYLDYGVAAKRYAQLEDARTNANAVLDAEAGTDDGLNTLIGKIDSLALIKYDTSFAIIKAAQASRVALVADYLLGMPGTPENFIFEGIDGDHPQTEETCKANLKAIIGTENEEKLTASGARMEKLYDAYDAAHLADTGVIALINKITTSPYVLDRAADLEAAKAAYTKWKTDFEIDLGKDGDTLTVNDGTTILGEAYTTMTTTDAQYAAALAQKKVVLDKIAAIQLPVVNDANKPEIMEARDEFKTLCELNLDTTTDGNQPTYKHLPTEYDKLVNAEADVFAIQFAHFLYNKEAVIEGYRAAYTAKIGGEMVRENDTNALGAAKTATLGVLQAYADTYSADKAALAIYAGKSIADYKTAAEADVNEFCVDAEANFKVAARYIITIDGDKVCTMTIYAGGNYVASELLSPEGWVPPQYDKVVILTTDAVTLTGVKANEIVYGEATAAAVLALPTLTLSGVDASLVTINTACELIVTDAAEVKSEIDKIVVTAATTLNGQGANALTVEATAAVTGTVANDILINTNANVDLTAKNIEAVVAKNGDVVPTVKLTATEEVVVKADQGIGTDDVTGAVVKKFVYIGDDFGSAGDDDLANGDNWTEIV